MKNTKILIAALSISMFTFACDKAGNSNTTANNTTANNTTTNKTETAPVAADSNASKVNSAQSNDVSSIYTDLTEEKCKTIESSTDEGGGYTGECSGVGGYKLEVLEGDLRQTINVVAPDGKKTELNLWTNVSSAFSSVGEKAEWRVRGSGDKAKPFALIVRYNASDNPEKPDQNTSLLVVTKITDKMTCVTDVVKPSKDANAEAQRLADISADKPCVVKK